MKRLAACVVAFLSFVPIIFAQEAAPPAKEAPVAMLSVVVTDGRGNHIPSLTKEDFQVALGGTPLDVAKFSERGAVGAPTREMRRIVVLFDMTTISASARRQAADSVHRFLERALRPGDLAAVLSGGQSLRAMTGWTTDLKEIDTALGQFTGESSIPITSPHAGSRNGIPARSTANAQA